MPKKNGLEDTFSLQIRALKLAPPVREYHFAKDSGHPLHGGRRWRFDFAYPEIKLAVEIDGGTWNSKSRHTTGSGFQGDCEKLNAAAEMGWLVLRGDSQMVTDGRLIAALERTIKTMQGRTRHHALSSGPADRENTCQV